LTKQASELLLPIYMYFKIELPRSEDLIGPHLDLSFCPFSVLWNSCVNSYAPLIWTKSSLKMH